MKPYKPQGKTEKILDRAYELVQSVPYRVSARWLFYRLLQEGYYSSKDDYKNKFLFVLSDARKCFYKEWKPDTLVDDRREVIKRGDGWADAKSWLEAVSEASCTIDKWQSQDYYVELWFEANAMAAQFEYYTENITLRPMGGQPSIPYKWQAAKELEQAYRVYGKPVVILYFGDLDEGGENIGNAVETDVTEWCNVSFTFLRCGLTAAQVLEYQIPENVEKPGCYQWEALTDDVAREIIEASLEGFVSHDRFSEIAEREQKASRWLTDNLSALLSSYED